MQKGYVSPKVDRDAKYSEAFRFMLNGTDVEPVRLLPRSPNMNSHIERFMGSLKEECLERLILFGEESIRNVVSSFMTHYHMERNYQGLGKWIIQPGAEVGKAQGEIVCHNRIGGILRYYHRKVA
jgi:putative transposase